MSLFSKYKKPDMKFNVVGVTYDNKDGTNRQTVIKEMVKDAKQYCERGDLYGGMKDSEITEEDGNVYEHPDVGAGHVWFQESTFDGEPAVEVWSDFGQIGYVPKADLGQFLPLFHEAKKVSVYGQFVGGKYKYYDAVDDRVRTGTKTYGVSLYVVFKIPKK